MTNLKLPLIAAIVLPLTLLTACGGGGSSTPANTGGNSPLDANTDAGGDTNIPDAGTNIPDTGTNIPATGTGLFAGNYSTGCSPGVPATDEITITSNTFIQSSALYSDAACTTPIFATTLTWNLSFTNGTTETDLGTAQHITKTLTGFVLNGEDISAASDKPTYYELVLLDGINLYLSDDEAETPAERSTSLDSDPYVRQ